MALRSIKSVTHVHKINRIMKFKYQITGLCSHYVNKLVMTYNAVKEQRLKWLFSYSHITPFYICSFHTPLHPSSLFQSFAAFTIQCWICGAALTSYDKCRHASCYLWQQNRQQRFTVMSLLHSLPTYIHLNFPSLNSVFKFGFNTCEWFHDRLLGIVVSLKGHLLCVCGYLCTLR